jgi:hypothetical protein
MWVDDRSAASAADANVGKGARADRQTATNLDRSFAKLGSWRQSRTGGGCASNVGELQMVVATAFIASRAATRIGFQF